MSFATTWVELEGIMLSKISQSETTEDHRGREEKIKEDKTKEGNKPYETLNHRKQTEGCWKGVGSVG